MSHEHQSKVTSYSSVLAREGSREIIEEWRKSSPIPFDRLTLITFSYIDFNQNVHHDGEIVVFDAFASRAQKIFKEVFDRKAPIAKAKRIDSYYQTTMDSLQMTSLQNLSKEALNEFYEMLDEASMSDNNTSSYFPRPIIGGNHPSMHAFGAAIDYNPRENPFVEEVDKKGRRLVKPIEGANTYINRLRAQEEGLPGLAEKVQDIFKRNGFTRWGGMWNFPIDWQHFEVPRPVTELLTKISPKDAKALFEMYAEAPERIMGVLSESKSNLINLYKDDTKKFMNLFE